MGKRKLNNKYYKEEENSDQEHEISENFLSVNELVLMLQKVSKISINFTKKLFIYIKTKIFLLAEFLGTN
jgi:hypothetical protein